MMGIRGVDEGLMEDQKRVVSIYVQKSCLYGQVKDISYPCCRTRSHGLEDNRRDAGGRSQSELVALHKC